MIPPKDKAIKGLATMASKANSIFMLRTFSLIASLIAVALVASSHFQLWGFRYDFEDIVTFRYVMAVTVMSIVYGGVQLPFAGYYALKHKRLIPHRFEFYADKVMSVLLATGSGAGIAVPRELKKALGGGDGGSGGHGDDYWLDNNMSPPERQSEKSAMEPFFKFMDKLLAASVFLLLAWLCLALVSIISYNHNNNNNTNPILSTRQSNTTLEPSPPKESPQHTHVPTETVPPPSGGVSV